ncbi:hypothetical protein VTO42DRAFT_3263 [Malbranchea cinnamomea]
MAAYIRSAKVTLACPLFAADFDPRNDDFLIVGGGGGEGRSGVGNKIYLLDTSRPESLSQIGELDLSRNEDSVSSLAVAHSCDESLIALAGINSSQEEQQKNRNEHLRTFRLDSLPKNKSSNETGVKVMKNERDSKSHGKIKEVSRVSFFRPEKSAAGKEKETYQRILRLSPWRGEDAKRVAAIATGFAPQGEIVLFNADSTNPQPSDILERLILGDNVEAEDVDIISTSAGYKIAYTDGNSLHASMISPMKPRSIYTAPKTNGKKHKIRALRFLSQNFLIILQNTANRTGCELILLKHTQPTEAVVIRRQKLPASAKVGLGLDVCALPESAIGTRQYVVAASAGDHSISIFTLDYAPGKGFSKFKSYARFRDVHPFSMTKLVFSTFTPPAHPTGPETPTQYIKLASVSVGNTAVVHTLPLAPYPEKSQTPRYVLARGESEFWTTIFSSVMALIVVAIGAFLLQAFNEIRGGVPPTLGAVNWLSPRIREIMARPYMADSEQITSVLSSYSSDIPTLRTTTSEPLRAPLYLKMLRQEIEMRPEASVQVIVEDHGHGEISVKAVGGADAVELPDTLVKWEDLSDGERRIWKLKLVAAGHLRDEDDESFLRGVHFVELANSQSGSGFQ